MKKQFGRRPSGDKPAWKKSGAGAGKSAYPKKRFSSDKNAERSDPKKNGDNSISKKPYEKNSFGDRDDRGKRKFGDKPFSKKPYEKREGGERKFGDKPFSKKSYGDREDRRKKEFGDKPFFKKPFEKREGGERKFGDKPFSKKPYEKKSFGNEPFEKKPFISKESSFGRPYKKKTFADRKQFNKFNKPEIKDREDKIKAEDWQVFENADDAKAYIKSNREEKKSSGKSFDETPKEFKNDNRPLRAAAYNDNETSVRLNRFIANTGICSRREADDLITAGVVKVNGKIVTELGTKVGPGDTIHYGDQLLRREKMSYVLLNKPKDYITTTDDPQERKTVMALIEEAGKERIYPVGRLDRNTTGLLLFTNDGDLAQRLTHPKNNVRKIYHVSLDKNLKNDDFEKILKGYEMEDGFMKADELSFVGDGLDKKEVGIVIHSGRNRIVRRLFEGLGYDVVKLDRVSYAGLTKKNLPRGRFRHLTTEEVGILRMQIGGEKKTNFKKSDRQHTKGKRPRK